MEGDLIFRNLYLESSRSDASTYYEMLNILIELMICSEYWSEYDVPIGIHDRIRSAVENATGLKAEEIKEATK